MMITDLGKIDDYDSGMGIEAEHLVTSGGLREVHLGGPQFSEFIVGLDDLLGGKDNMGMDENHNYIAGC